ncbi:glycosyltransferase family 2 protein [Paraburkholderia unamae]|uniref:glycosyltransferase family 2 protein n=1 Tax=Paraburkholderia unamae TaxID=219649 RepID=UPI000DD43959|nr:glycosyltransferase family 2 protein [Paraburkholderia unamae]
MIASNTQQPGVALSVSVVAYRPDVHQLLNTLQSLRIAVLAGRQSRQVDASLYLVDNGALPDLTSILHELEGDGVTCVTISGHGNVGYGRGHNLAIGRTTADYHLVLNPDIDLAPDSLAQALEFLDKHPNAGLLSPQIGDDQQDLQFLCRRYPTVLDLFLRGFVPAGFQRPFSERLDRYEMRDVINKSEVVWDPPLVSGCFMLFRTEVLKRIGGFDPRYFLYFEDYDLSIRTRDVARIAYMPAVRVLHHGGGAARKGWPHIRMFVTSAVKFFNRFGWKWL